MKHPTTRSALQLISTSGVYGAERVVLELAQHLKARNWNSRIAILESPGAAALKSEAERAGIEAQVLTAGRGFLGLQHALRAYAAQCGADIVHSHGYRTDVVLGTTSLPRRTRRVATCHTWYSDSVKMKMYEYLDKLLLRRFDLVVTVAESLLSDVRSGWVRPERSLMIRNGLDLLPAESGVERAVRASFGLDADAIMILRVGRLALSKGNDLLLQAIAELPGAPLKVVFAGGGEEEARLRAQASALKISDQVLFAGFRSDVAALLAAADLFVICSREEGLPMVLLEAMAAGRPIVSTTVGAIPTVITDGVTGLLIPPGDAAALRAAMRRLIDDRALAARLGADAAIEHAASYSRAAMGDSYLKCYEKLLA